MGTTVSFRRDRINVEKGYLLSKKELDCKKVAGTLSVDIVTPCVTSKMIMTKNTNTIHQIPKFASVQEEAEFWDTHDAGDYLTEFKEIKAVYDPSGATKTTISVRLDEGLKTQLKRVADQYDISTSSLVRMWVVDRLRALG